MKTTKNDSTIADWEKEVARIVQEAVEEQMDWEAYYSGESPEHVEEIVEIVEQVIAQALASQHERDIQAFEEMIGEDESLNNPETLPSDSLVRNELRAELRQKLRGMK